MKKCIEFNVVGKENGPARYSAYDPYCRTRFGYLKVEVLGHLVRFPTADDSADSFIIDGTHCEWLPLEEQIAISNFVFPMFRGTEQSYTVDVESIPMSLRNALAV